LYQWLEVDFAKKHLVLFQTTDPLSYSNSSFRLNGPVSRSGEKPNVVRMMDSSRNGSGGVSHAVSCLRPSPIPVAMALAEGICEFLESPTSCSHAIVDSIVNCKAPIGIDLRDGEMSEPPLLRELTPCFFQVQVTMVIPAETQLPIP
jgi:hypothetical protein